MEKIYFITEIVLLLAACATAVIVSVKNAKLRKDVSQKERSIKDLTDIIYQDMRKRVSLENKTNRLKLEYENLKGHITKLVADLPERRENESDAHYNQRCRQTVVNKAAKYVRLSENNAILTVLS
jgi:septal ring factor EnvC (AmiA/AmiB activator)